MTGIHVATIFKSNFWDSLLISFEDTAKKEKTETVKRNLNKDRMIERGVLTQILKDAIDK